MRESWSRVRSVTPFPGFTAENRPSAERPRWSRIISNFLDEKSHETDDDTLSDVLPATGQPAAALIRKRIPQRIVAVNDEVPTMKAHEDHQFVEQLFEQQILRLTRAANSFEVQHSDAWL